LTESPKGGKLSGLDYEKNKDGTIWRGAQRPRRERYAVARHLLQLPQLAKKKMVSRWGAQRGQGVLREIDLIVNF